MIGINIFRYKPYEKIKNVPNMKKNLQHNVCRNTNNPIVYIPMQYAQVDILCRHCICPPTQNNIICCYS